MALVLRHRSPPNARLFFGLEFPLVCSRVGLLPGGEQKARRHAPASHVSHPRKRREDLTGGSHLRGQRRRQVQFAQAASLWETGGTGRPRENARHSRTAFRFADTREQPSTFDLQFLTRGKLYRFGFSVDDERIAEEWLAEVSGNQERLIYERNTDNNSKIEINAPGLKNASPLPGKSS